MRYYEILIKSSSSQNITNNNFLKLIIKDIVDHKFFDKIFNIVYQNAKKDIFDNLYINNISYNLLKLVIIDINIFKIFKLNLLYYLKHAEFKILISNKTWITPVKY